MLSACAGQPLDLTSQLDVAATNGARRAGGHSFEMTNQDAFVVVPFSGSLHWQKLRLTASGLDHVAAATVYYGEPFSEERRVVGWFDRAAGNVDFLLPSGTHGALRIDFDLDVPETHVQISRLEVLPFSVLDQRALQQVLVYVFALLMVLACLGPGLLVFATLHRRDPTELGLQLAFGYSLLFYAVLYVGLCALQRAAPWVVFAVWLAGLSALAAACDRRLLVSVLREHRPELVWLVVLVVAAAFFVTFDADRPFANLGFHHIAGWKTFGAIQAHDNYFQYVNGRAIAEGEPFSRYYGGARLTYDVTAREMLPGAIYAVFRALLATFSWRLSDSYLVYTLFGIVSNAAVALPLASLVRRLFPSVSLWKAALALAATSSFFANVYYTWFKYSGAALFLSAVVLLMIDRSRLRSWVLAGLLVGLSVNMHTGNLLGLPAFLAYFAWVSWRERRELRGPAAVLATVLAAMAPWTVVKARWLHPDNTLFVQHYLDGHQRADGVVASLREFLEQTPPQRQLSYRAERLAASLRLAELGDWFGAFGRVPLREQWVRLGWLEVRYLAPLFYPLALFALLAWRNRRAPAPVERWPFFWLSALTAFVLVVASFGVFPADINFSQPMAVVLLACLCLAGMALEGGRSVASIFLVFCGLQVLRSAAVLLGHYVTHFD